MKKRDLEKRLREMARGSGITVIFSSGAKHDKLEICGHVIAVPRHREINELTAKAILQEMQNILEKLES